MSRVDEYTHHHDREQPLVRVCSRYMPAARAADTCTWAAHGTSSACCFCCGRSNDHTAYVLARDPANSAHAAATTLRAHGDSDEHLLMYHAGATHVWRSHTTDRVVIIANDTVISTPCAGGDRAVELRVAHQALSASRAAQRGVNLTALQHAAAAMNAVPLEQRHWFMPAAIKRTARRAEHDRHPSIRSVSLTDYYALMQARFNTRAQR